MPRIRTIKPEFFTHAELFDAEHETGLPLRLAYAGLWCCADREGRFRWKPRELKLHVLPFDDVDMSRVLDALTTRGFLVHYASQGTEYGCIPTFPIHQVINNREKSSEIPSPDDLGIDLISTRAPRVPHACPTPLVQDQGEGKGREGKGTDNTKANALGAEAPRNSFEKDYFAEGKRILGPKAGGVLTKLKTAKGSTEAAYAVLMAAEAAENPMEYVQGSIREKPQTQPPPRPQCDPQHNEVWAEVRRQMAERDAEKRGELNGHATGA